MSPAPRTFLDHNATSALRPEAAEAVLRAMTLGGNPSSVHTEGRAARALVEDAREAVAGLAGGRARNVVFTSGGTEANVLALTPGIVFAGGVRPTRLLASAIEHPCVLQGARFAAGSVETIPVLQSGVIDLDALERRLGALAGQGERVLVALQAANNETGVIQPVREAADIVHAAGGFLHCDAVQAAGKIRFDMESSGADSAAFSAHKIGGPQGVGALVLRDAATHIEDRLLRGGGQERGVRAGTENVPGIAGFGAAARAVLAGSADGEGIALLRNALEQGLRERAPVVVIFGDDAARLPNTTLFALPGLSAATALIAFDLAGVAVSSGAACSSGKVKTSHVLEAMGVASALADGAIRVSLGWNSSNPDVIRFLLAFEKVRDAYRDRQARRAA